MYTSAMSKRLVAHESVYDKVDELATEKDMTKKEVLRDILKEAGYDV